LYTSSYSIRVIKEDEMGEECSMYGKHEKLHTKFWLST